MGRTHTCIGINSKLNVFIYHQAVLKYLRECLNEIEDGEPESSDSADNISSKYTIPLQPIDNKFSLVASM